VRWQLQEALKQTRPVAPMVTASGSAAPPGGAPVDRPDGRADPPVKQILSLKK